MDPFAALPAPATDPAQLPALLWQLVRDLADPTITYLLGGHYYDRTNLRWSSNAGQKKDVYFFCHDRKKERDVARQTA